VSDSPRFERRGPASVARVEGAGYTGLVRGGDEIRAVVFDAGNTLVRMNYAAVARELATRGVRTTPEDVQRAEWRARVRLDAEVFARAPGTSTESRSSAAHYVRLILEALGVTDAAVVEAIVEWRRSYNAPTGLFDVADPVAEPALRLVRDRGLTAGVVSNSNGTVRSILQTLGFLPYLAFVLDSTEVGVEKPDPRIFRLAVEQARVTPREAVYVGDLYSVDVRGARAAGLDAILLDPAGLWGARDCRKAPDVLAAVRLALDSR
jgi:putative hydrolase of the HAD superfamily